jgi:hypothetical protein
LGKHNFDIFSSVVYGCCINFLLPFFWAKNFNIFDQQFSKFLSFLKII